MPAARKSTTRTPATRSTNRAPASSTPATRREVERRIARVETLLEDVGEALQLLAKDMGRGGQDAYKELTRTAKALRRDAQRTNKRMLKDFDKLRAAVTPSGRTRRSSDTHHVPFQRHSDSYGIKAINPRHSLDPPGLHQETDYGIDAPPRADQRVGTEPNHIEIIEVEPLKTTLPNAVPAVPSRSSESRSRGTNTALASRRPRAAAARPAAALGRDQCRRCSQRRREKSARRASAHPLCRRGGSLVTLLLTDKTSQGGHSGLAWLRRRLGTRGHRRRFNAKAVARLEPPYASEPGGVQLTDWIRAEGDAE